MSRVTCHVPRATCHMSHVTTFCSFFPGQSIFFLSRSQMKLDSFYWANSVIKSPCPSVCLSVCLSLCLWQFKTPYSGGCWGLIANIGMQWHNFCFQLLGTIFSYAGTTIFITQGWQKAFFNLCVGEVLVMLDSLFRALTFIRNIKAKMEIKRVQNKSH